MLELQAQDMRIRSLQVKLRTIPLERAKLVAEFNVVKNALAKAKTEYQQAEHAVKDWEAQVQQAEEYRKKLQTQSASVKKNDEYQTMMVEIDRVTTKISDLETLQLQAIDESEKKKAELREVTRVYNSTGRTIQTELKEFEALKVEIDRQIEVASDLSKLIEKKVEMNILPTYQRLLAGGKGEPLAAVMNGGLCSNCSLKLTPQTLNLASKGQVVYCDNCSHFVYDPNAEDLA